MGRRCKLFLAFVFAAAVCSVAVPPRALPAGPSLAPLDALPAEVRSAPAPVQEAYRYALAHPDLLKAIPCYCGCEVVRHRSNYGCYVEEVRPDGSVVFSDHALG